MIRLAYFSSRIRYIIFVRHPIIKKSDLLRSVTLLNCLVKCVKQIEAKTETRMVSHFAPISDVRLMDNNKVNDNVSNFGPEGHNF